MTSSRFATIAHDLRERIALGEFGDVGALDSESQLCARYAVSRPTVRRALEVLRDEGLVESRHGAGWFVTGSAFHQRLAIGSFRHAASAVAEAGKTIDRHVVEFGYRPAPLSLAGSLGVDEGTEVLSVRSLRTVDGEGLDVVREWVPADLAGPVSRDSATRPGIWETLTRHGHRIATVRQVVTAGLASDEDAQLLGVARRRTAPRPSVRRRPDRPRPRALRPPLPRPAVRPRGRVQLGPERQRRRDRRAHRHPRRPLP